VATALVGVLGVIIGLLGGYLLRGREFVRDQRLRLYSEYVASFLDVTKAGAELASMFLALEDGMKRPEHEATVRPLWNAWDKTEPEFSRAAARVRLVVTDNLREHADRLEMFVDRFVRAAPPITRTRPPEGNVPAPAEVLRRANNLANDFAEAARPEVGSATGMASRLRQWGLRK
jgi:hypothetical protein